MRSLAILITRSASFVEGNAQVMGVAEVIYLAGLHPDGQGVPLFLQAALAAGVQGDPGGRRVLVPLDLLAPGHLVNAVLPGGAGGAGGVLQRHEGVDGLLRPRPVQVRAGLGDGRELAQQMRRTRRARPRR
jgi:hypothetical protein